MSTTMNAETTESFLALWERAIELSNPNSRDAMEAERARVWSGDNRTTKTAKATLAWIARTADKSTDEGRELANAAKNLRAGLG